MATILADRSRVETSPSFEPAGGDAALLSLLHALGRREYHFVTPTPATHARVVGRPSRGLARSLTDIFGWSLPFHPGMLADDMASALRAADGIDQLPGGLLRSRYRVSAVHGCLYLHSAYPTEAGDSVFLGPDSYRFADLIEAELERSPPPVGASVVDIGAGAGVGGIVAARLRPDLLVTMTDINAQALRLARLNAIVAGVDVELALGAGFDAAPGSFDIVLINPPFIMDPAGRGYRDGGGMRGSEVALDMAAMALERLRAKGRLILYTGSALIDGADPLKETLADLAGRMRCSMRYREIDPDIFGEELDSPAYADVDRIAAVAAVIQRDG